MSTPVVRYRNGLRFQLAEPFQCATPITEACAGNHWVGLAADGTLTIAAGYAWDGASGPIAQGPEVIRASLVHDALYQLMRECGLAATWRQPADALLRQMLVEDGLHAAMAALVYQAVRTFGAQFADPKSQRPVLTAPCVPEPQPEPYLP
jgi:hypothetical protein